MEYLMAAEVAISALGTLFGAASQKKQNRIAERAAQQQAEEIKRQREIEEQRQRRENEELMNSVSNLTNTAWSGANAPSLAFDKYGDLG